MARKSDAKPDDPKQYKRFIDAAREAGANQSREGADRAFRKIVKPPVPKKKDSRKG